MRQQPAKVKNHENAFVFFFALPSLWERSQICALQQKFGRKVFTPKVFFDTFLQKFLNERSVVGSGKTAHISLEVLLNLCDSHQDIKSLHFKAQDITESQVSPNVCRPQVWAMVCRTFCKRFPSQRFFPQTFLQKFWKKRSVVGGGYNVQKSLEILFNP